MALSLDRILLTFPSFDILLLMLLTTVPVQQLDEDGRIRCFSVVMSSSSNVADFAACLCMLCYCGAHAGQPSSIRRDYKGWFIYFSELASAPAKICRSCHTWQHGCLREKASCCKCECVHLCTGNSTISLLCTEAEVSPQTHPVVLCTGSVRSCCR